MEVCGISMSRDATGRGVSVALQSWVLGSALLLSLVILLSLAGCASGSKIAFQSGLPGMRVGMEVVRVVERAGYLEAHLQLEDVSIQAYTAPSEVCREVFEEGVRIDFVDNGPRGRWRRGEVDCDGLGFGPLEVWRDRSTRSTRGGGTPIPRAQANFRVVYQDDEVAYLSGSFPLAGRFGFTGANLMTAIVANEGECVGVIEGRTSGMEYRPSGRLAYSFTGPKGQCRIAGFAMPVRAATTK